MGLEYLGRFEWIFRRGEWQRYGKILENCQFG